MNWSWPAATCSDSFEKYALLNRPHPGTAADWLIPVCADPPCAHRVSDGAMQWGAPLRENRLRDGWLLERPRAYVAREP